MRYKTCYEQAQDFFSIVCAIYRFNFLPISGQHINLDIRLMRTASAFCNKIWQASRFFVMTMEKAKIENIEKFCVLTLHPGDLRPENAWILSRCSVAVNEVNLHLENADFHFLTRALREFLYSNLCDIYLVRN